LANPFADTVLNESSQKEKEKEKEKIKVKIQSQAESESSNQISSLLERYHALKSGYLSNLRQLDELIHFQKQQEDSEIDKINHLLADLHRRNDSIKQICSIKELPPPS
jgi:hypothetical protein